MNDEEAQRLQAIWKKYVIPRECRVEIINLIFAVIERLENPQETRWLANAERQREDIDKSEVEFFEKLRAPVEQEG